MYHSSKSRYFLPFYLVTWAHLDLYYGYKAQEWYLPVKRLIGRLTSERLVRSVNLFVSVQLHFVVNYCVNPRPYRGGVGATPLRFFADSEKTAALRAAGFWATLWGPNIDLEPKIIPTIASTRREQSAGLFREALRRFVWKRQGGGGSHQPTPAKVAKHGLRARVNKLWTMCLFVSNDIRFSRSNIGSNLLMIARLHLNRHA